MLGKLQERITLQQAIFGVLRRCFPFCILWCFIYLSELLSAAWAGLKLSKFDHFSTIKVLSAAPPLPQVYLEMQSSCRDNSRHCPLMAQPRSRGLGALHRVAGGWDWPRDGLRTPTSITSPSSVGSQPQLCPWSRREFLWLHPPLLRGPEKLDQFSPKRNYLFLHQILYLGSLHSDEQQWPSREVLFVLSHRAAAIWAQQELPMQLESSKKEWKKWGHALQRKQLPKPWFTPRKGNAGPGGNQILGWWRWCHALLGVMLCPTSLLSGMGNKGAIMARQKKKEDKWWSCIYIAHFIPNRRVNWLIYKLHLKRSLHPSLTRRYL